MQTQFSFTERIYQAVPGGQSVTPNTHLTDPRVMGACLAIGGFGLETCAILAAAYARDNKEAAGAAAIGVLGMVFITVGMLRCCCRPRRTQE